MMRTPDLKNLGRPKGQNQMTTRITTPLRPELRLAIEQRARDLGFQSIAAYIRSVLERDVDLTPAKDEE